MPATVHIVALLYHPPLAHKTVACATWLLNKLKRRGHAGTLLAVVNNADIDRSALACESLVHDNTGLEFGGYQRALEALGTLHDDCSVLFLNDTCVSHHVFGVVPRTNLLAAARDMALLARAEAAGVVSSSPIGSFSIEGLVLDRWISTWAFAVNRAGLDALSRSIYTPALDELVTGAASVDAFWDPSLDRSLVAHLNTWLFGDPEQHRWYGATSLTSQNAASFARKARCILQEKYLSARLLQCGAQLRSIRPTGWPQRIFHRLECVREGRPAGFV
jgi:hypothetical protein